MAEYPFPNDPRFRKFACRVSDAVLVAINSGEKIGNEEGCRCPLSCLDLTGSKFPFPSHLDRRNLGTTKDELWKFINGFSGNYVEVGPHYELGKAYRRRFVEGAK